MKNIKKLLASLMVAVMILTTAPLSGFVGLKLNLDWLDFNTKVSAATYSGTCGDNLTWSLDANTGKLVIIGTGAMYNYTVEDKYKGVYITTAPWGSYMSSISSVTIQNSVTSIGDYAFYGCKSLTSVTIGNSVTCIGDYAFSGGCTGLTSITIPDSVTSIGYDAFSGCTNLTSITIPDSVTSIGSSAFSYCTSLTSVIIGNGVTSIGNYAFSNCSGIKELTMPISAKIFNSSYTFYNCTNIEKITLTKGNGTAQNYATSSTGYSETYYQYTPWYISECSEIVIEDGVTGIGFYTFLGCTALKTVYYTGDVAGWCAISFISSHSNPMYYADNLYIGGELITELFIPDSVTSIGNYAFYGCTGLTSVTIGDSVTSIGDDVFCGCTGLTSVTIGDSVTSIGNDVFCGCTGLTSVTIGDSVTSIGNDVFCGCTGLTSVTIGNSVTSIGYNAFYGCTALENVYYTGDVAGWCAISFISSHSNPMYYADNLYIGGELITELFIPDSVTSIGNYAFYGCTGLTSVTIGSGLTSLDTLVFKGCTSLSSISVSEGNECFFSDKDGVLYNKNKTTLVLYPAGSKKSDYTIPDGVTSISSYAFYGCTGLTSVTIPDSVSVIGDYAFCNCTGLTNVTIGNSVTSISGYAFNGCTGLTSIIIPDSVTSISGYAFAGCTGLTSVTIGDSVRGIGKDAFDNCRGINELTMPISANIYYYYFGDESSFSGCTNIKKITLTKGNGTVQSYGTSTSSVSNTYYAATPWYISREKCTEIIIEDGVTGIGSYTFYGCTGLTSITIPDSVTSIGSSAFSYCTSLTSITIPDSVTSIGSSAFYGCTKIKSTYYNGLASQWSQINIGTGNNYLVENIIFDYNSLRRRQDAGTCGENLTYTLYIDGELVISGTGSMDNYTPLSPAPWDNYNDIIKTVTINNGAVSIGDYAFNNILTMESIVIPESVKTVGTVAFSGASGLTDVYYSGTETEWNEIAIGNSNGYLKNAAKHYGHTHDFVQVVLVPSTCVANGQCKLECECGSVQSYESLPLSGHTASEWKTVVAAGCLTEGSKKKECTVCNEVLETASIQATGHTTSNWITDVAAKCETEGSKHKECTVCHTVLETQTIPANGHKKGDWTIAKSATTSAEGERVKKCTVCSTVLEREAIPKLDPVCDYLKWKVSGGSIVITGFYSGLSGDVVLPESINGYDVTEIAAKAFLNNSKITSIQVPARVTSIGEAAFAYCRNLKSVTIPWGISSIDQAAFIGCTNLEEIKIYDDYYEEYTNDGLYFKTDDRGVLFSINRNSGNKIEVFYAPAKAVGEAYTIPDFATSAKNSAFADCKDFSLTLSDGFDVAYNSVFFQLLSVNEFIASENCVKFSTADGVLYSKDGKTLVKYPVDSDRQLYVVPDTVTSLASDSVFYVMEEEQELIMKYNLSYSFDNIVKVPAHLTVHIPSGMSLDRFLIGPSHYCVSGYTQTEISAGNSLVSEEIAYWTEYWDEIRYEYSSSSVEYKMYNNYVTCMKNAYGTFEVCEEDHTNSYPFCNVIGTVSPTCTKDGYDKYRCAECGYTFNVVVKATGHNHNAVVTEPTCTKQGYTTYTCACGDRYVDDYVDATGHSYTAVVTAPTCTEQGYTTYTCECGDSYVDDYIDAIGHSYTSEVTTPATHTATGVMTYTCHCGDTYTETIDKIADHNYNAVVTAPTCEDKGYTTYTCVCGDSYVADYVDAKGHTAGEWVVTKPATSTQSGTKTQSCTVCGSVLNTQTIPAYGKVNSVSVSNVSLDYKSSTTLNPQISADAGVKYTVSYSSSNPSVASVDANGKITTKDTGSATITVTVTDEFGNTVSDTCNVEVKYNWWQWILVIVLFGWIWY